MADFDFAEVPTLATDRLLLRRISARDHEAWREVFNSPSLLDYLIGFEGAPRAEMMCEIVDWADRILREKTGIRWALTLKPSDLMIGSCGFHLYDAKEPQSGGRLRIALGLLAPGPHVGGAGGCPAILL